ncbi:MAG: ABC transporter permease [Myxococcaceae bacterium]|nr:ABC transporter permease [Myxococcaceae bacterium]MCA3016319.1 ABC transporter permease [Myxococcaceae bacterium]
MLGELGLGTVGFGTFLGALGGAGSLLAVEQQRAAASLLVNPEAVGSARLAVAVGAAAWVAGWLALSRGLTPRAAVARADSAAKGKPLFPRLANSRDFHWGTLAAYGFGLFAAEVAFVLVYLLLVGKASTGGAVTGGLAPVTAFVLAFGGSVGVAFGAGFLGAANSRRLSVPEFTTALLYFGLPVPAFLTAMHHVGWLMLNVGYKLREVVYLSSLLGESRPELGYWLVFAGLVLATFLGINLGFVATASGRFDLRTSYESFIASRHVAVFRPRLVIGVFLVLILGIVPPLILLAIVSAADAAVSRTRIKRLGLADPLLAAEALNEQRLAAQTPTAMMTALSVGGVGVGVMALVIVLSVMSGFEADLQKKILGTNSHGVVMKYTPEMPEYAEVVEKIHRVRGITGATPFILNEVMVSSEGNISGSMIKGVDPKTVGSVTDLPASLGCEAGRPCQPMEALEDPTKIRARRLEPGVGEGAIDDTPAKPPSPLIRDPMVELPAEAPDDSVLPGIVVGKELAASLRVVVGDRINVVSPLGGELGPNGPVPKSRPFRVAGVFYSGMYEYDSKFVYIHLREAQTFFGIKGASGVEVKVDDVDDARGIMKRIYDALDGYPYRTKDWGEMNRNLFAALRLEKLVMAIILTIIVIVAAGLIVATVIMLVLEKRKEIAVLKALGVPDGGIVKIFLSEGLQIGVVGSSLGLVSGLAWCLFIEKVGIKLDPQVYYIPALPVRIVPLQTVLAVVIAILVTFLASVYPALKASQVEPVEGLKSE